MNKRFWFALASTLSWVAFHAHSALELTRDGASDYVILVAADAPAPERNAAQELQTFIREASGAELPLVNTLPAGKPAIRVGTSAENGRLLGVDWNSLQDDEILIRQVGDDLVVAGDAPRGTLYAVYTFLEDALGVRFWTPEEIDVPRRPTLTLEVPERQYAPVFFNREPFSKVFIASPEFAVRHKVNGHWEEIPPEWGGHLEILKWCHTFFEYIPAATYAQEHPEWFAMRGGRREFANVQLCLTNPAMRREFIANVLAAIAAQPELKIVDISQNDNEGFCQCPACEKKVQELGNQTDLLLEFVNEVADAIHARHPEITVMTLAYQYTRPTPETVRPRPNVCIRLCSIECDFGAPLRSSANADFAKQLTEWRQVAPQLAIWNYVTNFSNYLLPHPNIESLGDDIRFFAENHVVSVFNQGDCANALPGDFSAMRAYINAKLLWDPRLETQAVMAEFIDGYYGAAAPLIREYWQLILRSYHQRKLYLRCYMSSTADWMPPEVLQQARSLMDQAQQAVAGVEPYSRRVAVARLSIDYALLSEFARGQSIEQLWSKYQISREELQALFRHSTQVATAAGLVHYRESTPYSVFAEAFNLNTATPSHSVAEVLDMLRHPTEYAEKLVDLPAPQLTVHHPGEWAERVPDAAAVGDEAVLLPGASNQWAVQYPIAQLDLPGNWEALVWLRTEADATGATATAGAYDGQSGRSQAVTANLTGEYQLFRIGVCQARGGYYLYAAATAGKPVYVGGFVLVKAAE